tara:strand:- start:105147 stop:106193 length:1047 start_codon:yes stop_codon:yes gene_type:complete
MMRALKRLSVRSSTAIKIPTIPETIALATRKLTMPSSPIAKPESADTQVWSMQRALTQTQYTTTTTSTAISIPPEMLSLYTLLTTSREMKQQQLNQQLDAYLLAFVTDYTSKPSDSASGSSASDGQQAFHFYMINYLLIELLHFGDNQIEKVLTTNLAGIPLGSFPVPLSGIFAVKLIQLFLNNMNKSRLEISTLIVNECSAFTTTSGIDPMSLCENLPSLLSMQIAFAYLERTVIGLDHASGAYVSDQNYRVAITILTLLINQGDLITMHYFALFLREKFPALCPIEITTLRRHLRDKCGNPRIIVWEKLNNGTGCIFPIPKEKMMQLQPAASPKDDVELVAFNTIR